MANFLALTLALIAATATVAQAANCTDAEVQQTEDLYVAAGQTAECAPNATVNGLFVWINFYCNDPCEPIMKQLALDLPDCYDGDINAKTSLQVTIDYCEGTTPTTSVPVFSSSGSADTIIIAPTKRPESTTPTVGRASSPAAATSSGDGVASSSGGGGAASSSSGSGSNAALPLSVRSWTNLLLLIAATWALAGSAC